MSAVQALQMPGTVAHMLGTVINYHHPIVEGELPSDGSRVEGVIPPIVPNSVFNATHEDVHILIVGGAVTGKTTFVNAILNEMKNLIPHHHLLILEETLELQCPMDNFVSMRTSSNQSMQDLLKITMRQRPVCTVHANDSRAGLLRIEQLISEVSARTYR